nr:putative methyltransferase c70.08c [Quercus suber]
MPSDQDHWSTPAYAAAASFVPRLTSTVLEYLSPQPNDRILDLGCGDGQLTARIAPSCADILGLDASQSFIASAQQDYSTVPNCTFRLQDVTRSAEWAEGENAGRWDKIFSNAALHWILCDEGTRMGVLQGMFRALKPGGEGRLVFEMGGAGNVAEVQAALVYALVHHAGMSVEQAASASPWFFPSTLLMEKMLRDVGFEVEKCESEYRPTRLTDEQEDGSGGVEGWLRLMGAQFFEAIEGQDKREAVVREVCAVLKTVLRSEEDGSRFLGNVRLRVVARKP